ncbi:ATP-binding cassette, subfamily B [Lachnospiraceae bacterium NK3A20]|nr:ATP-binding cassette, subfamily B [Lachnospiraceae bacterium NK3A20]
MSQDVKDQNQKQNQSSAVESDAMAMSGDKASGKETLWKVLRFIGVYRLLLLASIILAALSVVLTLYIPILFGDAIDGILGQGKVDFDHIAGCLSRILGLIALTSLATFAMNMINNRLTYKVVQDIRGRAIRHIQVLPLSWLDAHSTGDIVGRVIADADQLSDGLLLGFSQLFSGVVTIVVTLIFMLMKSVPVTILVILLTPVSFFVARFIASHSFHMFQKQTKTRGEQTALIEEMVGNEKVVKAFGYEKKASERFRRVNEELQEYSWRAVFFSSLTNPSTRAVNSVIYAGVALLGSHLILAGSLTVGGLSVLLNYANQYMKPFNDISSVITELQNAMACAARIFALIEAEPQTPDPEKDLSAVSGEVDIWDIAFSYDKSKAFIQDFGLRVKPGTRVAIVGPTGCGKTTVINLLMRFYDIDRGEILVDGENIHDVSRHSLRKNFGMVLQETWLKSGTVRENIAFGKPDATEEEIITAAKEAHSWEFIRRLPNGLDTIISDDSLSQGQKQLLCITRVMLTLPPMLILDEATSSIDTRTEILIQNAFDKLMEGRTSFVVAHRLSTIRGADIILVMRDGKIIERGNHTSLMAQNGFYTHLYNSQFAGVREV